MVDLRSPRPSQVNPPFRRQTDYCLETPEEKRKKRAEKRAAERELASLPRPRPRTVPRSEKGAKVAEESEAQMSTAAHGPKVKTASRDLDL